MDTKETQLQKKCKCQGVSGERHKANINIKANLFQFLQKY